MADAVPEERQPVTLTKAHCETPAGHELIELLAELSADGNVTREEMERLCAWLEVDRGVDFPALPFLYETIDQISADGEIREEELDRLAQAIERVLPKELRAAAATKRKESRDAKRSAQRESRRQSMIADRTQRRAARTSILTNQNRPPERIRKGNRDASRSSCRAWAHYCRVPRHRGVEQTSD